GQVFNSQNLLSNLSILQSDIETSARRNDLAAQLLARSLDNILDGYRQKLLPTLQVLANGANHKDLVLPSSQLAYNRVADQAGIQGSALQAADLPVNILLVADQKVISPTKYPAISYATKVRINQDTTVNYSVTVKFPSISNLDSVVLCTSLIVPDITVTGIDQQRVFTRRLNNDICKVADVLTETELTYSWTTLQFESLDNSEYNLVIGQGKQLGVEVVSDFEMVLDSGLSFQSIQPDIPRIEGRAVFTESLDKDSLIDINIIR
ncbi:hypothetical protein KC640_03070, partial [Candidatus Dojkabacteria bacterium]|nr:hypothetical protein [Candidatus Dojkabacteria bacterium]